VVSDSRDLGAVALDHTWAYLTPADAVHFEGRADVGEEMVR
jgi:hypothetical protein